MLRENSSGSHHASYTATTYRTDKPLHQSKVFYATVLLLNVADTKLLGVTLLSLVREQT